MTYEQYQTKCAFWGHVESPLSWKDYGWLVSNGFDEDSIMGISDDCAAGYDLAEAIQAQAEAVA